MDPRLKHGGLLRGEARSTSRKHEQSWPAMAPLRKKTDEAKSAASGSGWTETSPQGCGCHQCLTMGAL